MSEWFALKDDAFDSVAAKAAEFGGGAEAAIEEVLHEQAGPVIYGKVSALIHPSGRRFKGHARSATAANWPSYDKGHLSITVAARGKWHYLYFPDDGNTTRRHAGNQRMFERGAQAATPQVADMCIKNLMKKWEE